MGDGEKTMSPTKGILRCHHVLRLNEARNIKLIKRCPDIILRVGGRGYRRVLTATPWLPSMRPSKPKETLPEIQPSESFNDLRYRDGFSKSIPGGPTTNCSLEMMSDQSGGTLQLDCRPGFVGWSLFCVFHGCVQTTTGNYDKRRALSGFIRRVPHRRRYRRTCCQRTRCRPRNPGLLRTCKKKAQPTAIELERFLFAPAVFGCKPTNSDFDTAAEQLITQNGVMDPFFKGHGDSRHQRSRRETCAVAYCKAERSTFRPKGGPRLEGSKENPERWQESLRVYQLAR